MRFRLVGEAWILMRGALWITHVSGVDVCAEREQQTQDLEAAFPRRVVKRSAAVLTAAAGTGAQKATTSSAEWVAHNKQLQRWRW